LDITWQDTDARSGIATSGRWDAALNTDSNFGFVWPYGVYLLSSGPKSLQGTKRYY